uniref:Ataxin 7 like 1 n=1 Tax=Urocitellus parryii TaxID=9999 RepID=A0A8D2HPC6_UROPR
MTSERSRIPCLSAAAAEGTGKKQQEGRAMATLDRKVPSPEAFLGKPWSSWIDAAKLHCSDNVDLEEAGKEGGKSREVMRLNKEDMHLFGHYPAHDDFYLVVCSACNQVVKPQVFQSHCEKAAVVFVFNTGIPEFYLRLDVGVFVVCLLLFLLTL